MECKQARRPFIQISLKFDKGVHQVRMITSLGVTTEYTAFLEAPPKKGWIRGYAVKLDLPSP